MGRAADGRMLAGMKVHSHIWKTTTVMIAAALADCGGGLLGYRPYSTRVGLFIGAVGLVAMIIGAVVLLAVFVGLALNIFVT